MHSLVLIAQPVRQSRPKVLLADIAAEVDAAPRAVDHPVVIPELLVDMGQAVPGLCLTVGVGEALKDLKCLGAVVDRSGVVAEQTVIPADRVERTCLARLEADDPAQVERAGLPPSRLQLEITESAIVRPDDQSVPALRQLVELGVFVAIDDFGTGYSNLSYLRRLPVQVLKIDRSFVAELCPPGRTANAEDVAILEAITSLAQGLGLTVTAEGVETAGQADHLRSIGCEHAQGWYFGRPASSREIEAVIAARP